MRCADCREWLKSYDEVLCCETCARPMHACCAMLDPENADPRCEECHNEVQRELRKARRTEDNPPEEKTPADEKEDDRQASLLPLIYGEEDKCLH